MLEIQCVLIGYTFYVMCKSVLLYMCSYLQRHDFYQVDVTKTELIKNLLQNQPKAIKWYISPSMINPLVAGEGDA